MPGAHKMIADDHKPRDAGSTLWLTAGLFNLMVDEQLDSLRGVRQLLAGGEALNLDVLGVPGAANTLPGRDLTVTVRL